MKKSIIAAALFVVFLVLNRIPAEAHRNAPAATYSVTPGAPPKISLAVLYSVPPYELTSVPYQKRGDALLFKTAAPGFRNEGVPILIVGDVALFENKICILRKTKKSFNELEGPIIECLDRLFYGVVPPSEFIIAPPKWNLYQRDEVRHSLQSDTMGISFDFPVSQTLDPDAQSPWDGYFVYGGKSIPAGAKNLVIEFKITASEGVIWNYQSDAYNRGCEYSKPSLRIYIAKGPIYANDTAHRWWYTQGFELRNTPEGMVKLSVPLDGVGWAGIYAGQATDNLTGFRETVTGASWVGMTFGGGCFYSHGINVSNGTAKFNLQRMYCE